MIQHDRRSSRRYLPPATLVAIADFPTKTPKRVSIKDISGEGLCFLTETDISGESAFNLSLNAGGGGRGEHSLNIEISATIVWHIHDEATSLHTAGAKFVGLDGDARESFLKFLDSLEPKDQGD